MNESMGRRLSIVGVLLLALATLIVYRLVSLQFGIDSAYFAETALTEYRYRETRRPPRGELYDRNGVLLATNAIDYEIGLSPVLIMDREGTAEALSAAMGIPAEELLAEMEAPNPYVLLVRPAPAAMGQRVMALELDGVAVTPIPRRFYPHGSLASHLLGFVSLDGDGYYGVEGFYEEILHGELEVDDQSRIPFEASGGEGWRSGADLTLTIDSEVQHLAESALRRAQETMGAEGGTIIVSNPRTGEILAAASLPDYDPNRYDTADASAFENPAINHQFEPGSTMKVVTMALALDGGYVTRNSTYEDTAVMEVGGVPIYNWDRAAHGQTTMTQLLGKSLNVGAATLALKMGPTAYYDGLTRFGFGERTGVDLAGEIRGQVRRPGNAEWYESDLATNAFGQGLAVTPMQMVVAVGAIANEGQIMQPRMVLRRTDPDGTTTEFEPTVLRRAVSAETANTLTDMLSEALEEEASRALVPGYTIAGKTGTAEIPIPGGYDPEQTITSFIGYGPVDDPQFLVFVILNRPTVSRWGSETAAPLFAEVVSRLVVLMEIAPDDIRLAGR